MCDQRAVKRPLGIPESERRDLLDVLLRLHAAAMATFDCIEADSWDQDDVLAMVGLPDICNEFTQRMTSHAMQLRVQRVAKSGGLR